MGVRPNVARLKKGEVRSGVISSVRDLLGLVGVPLPANAWNIRLTLDGDLAFYGPWTRLEAALVRKKFSLRESADEFQATVALYPLTETFKVLDWFKEKLPGVTCEVFVGNGAGRTKLRAPRRGSDSKAAKVIEKLIEQPRRGRNGSVSQRRVRDALAGHKVVPPGARVQALRDAGYAVTLVADADRHLYKYCEGKPVQIVIGGTSTTCDGDLWLSQAYAAPGTT